MFSVFTNNIYASKDNEMLFNNHNLLIKENLLLSKFGKITASNNTNSNLLVINIQDLHSNKSVQLNINNILQLISKQYKINQIFVEGAYDKVDISWVYKIEDTSLRNRLIDQLIYIGRFTGAEYYAYKTKQNDILFGLEDKKIHKDNLNRLSKIIDKQKFYEYELKKIKSDIDFISMKYSSKKNQILNNIVNKYNIGEIDAVSFYELLFKLIKNINYDSVKYNNLLSIDITQFPNINKYIYLNKIQLNNKKISKEIKLFLTLIKTKLPYNTYINILKDTNNCLDIVKLSQYIYSISNTYNIDLEKFYPNLNIFVKNNLLVNSINPIQLLDEEKILLNNLRQSFSQNDTEYEILFLVDFYNVFKDYMTNKLTAENYDYFIKKIKQFKSVYSKYTVVNRLNNLSNDFELLDAYYDTNNHRNTIFINNMLNGRKITYHESADISKQVKDVIVVISGGYHTKGISQLLSNNKISYITITPNIESSIQESEQYYKYIIKEQAKINTNALSFTIASSMNDISQFNASIEAGAKLFGAIYSEDIISQLITQMKPLVKEQIDYIYTDKITIINVGARQIILKNNGGIIQNITGSNEISNQAISVQTSYINNFFNSNPSFAFSDGLIFKLRKADKYITEIKGIDLSVIARLPTFIQEYFYNQLSYDIKQKISSSDSSVTLAQDSLMLNKIQTVKNKILNFYKKIIVPLIAVSLIVVSLIGYIHIERYHNFDNELLYSGYENSYFSHINYFDEIFDVNISSQNETEYLKIQKLHDFVNKTIQKNGSDNLYISLFEIRENITVLGSDLMPSISNEESNFTGVWRKLLTYIDKIIAYNIDDITGDALLNDKLISMYSESEIKYLRIYSADSYDELNNIITNTDENIKYRFYAYMVAKANGYKIKNEASMEILDRETIFKYLIDEYSFTDANGQIKFNNIENSYDWQMLCGMMNCILNAGEDYKYILDNGRIVNSGVDSDGINAMAKSNLLYANSAEQSLPDANSAPIFIAVHEMAHRKQNNTFGYLSNVMELYAYTVENITSHEMGIDLSYKKTIPVFNVVNNTETHDVGRITIEAVKRATGVETLIYLEEAIVEYVESGPEKNTTQTQMIDEIINLFASKIVLKEMKEGKIDDLDKETRYFEIISQIYGYNEFFDSIFNLSNGLRISDKDIKLKEYIYSVFHDIDTKEEFCAALLTIRKEITSADSVYMPNLTTYSDNWKKTVNKIDIAIISNIEQIKNSPQLTKQLQDIYTDSDIEYLTVSSNPDSLIDVMKEHEDIQYRFYAYMLLIQNDRKSKDKYRDLFSDGDLKTYLSTYAKEHISAIEINNFDWQVLCGMTQFLYGEKFNMYTFDNVLSIKYDDSVDYSMIIFSNSYIYQSSLNYIQNTTTNPVLVAVVANELYNLQHCFIASNPQIDDIRMSLSDLYINTCLLEAAKDLSIDFSIDTDTKASIRDINENTSSQDASKIILNEIINKYGYDSLSVLHSSIYEYMTSGGPVYRALKGVFDEINANQTIQYGVTIEEFQNILSEYIANNVLTEEARKGLLDFSDVFMNGRTTVQTRDYNTLINSYKTVVPGMKNNVNEVIKNFYYKLEEQNIPLLTRDNIFLNKIKSANIFKKLLIKFYAFHIAPYTEAKEINNIFKAMREDKEKAEMLKQDFLNKHSAFRNGDIETQEIFNNGLNNILSYINNIYISLYLKTNIASIAKISAYIVNIIAHKKWNKQQFNLNKQQQEETVITKIKKHVKRFIAGIMIIISVAFIGMSIASPDDLTKTCSSQAYIISNIDLSSKEDYYASILKIKKTLSTEEFMPTMDSLYYNPLWKFEIDSIDETIADGLIIITNDDKLNPLLRDIYSEQSIGYLKILSFRKDNEKLLQIINNETIYTNYRYYAHMLLMMNGYKMQHGEFDDLLSDENLLNWIYEFNEYDNKSSDFEWQTGCYIMKLLFDVDLPAWYIETFGRMINSSGQNIIGRSDLSYSADKEAKIPLLAAHEVGHNVLDFDIGPVRSSITQSPVHELYAYTMQEMVRIKAGVSENIGKQDAISSMDDNTEEHDAGRMIISSVIQNTGGENLYLLAEAITEHEKKVDFKSKSTREDMYEIVKIFADKYIDHEIEVGKMNETDREKEIEALVVNIMNYRQFFSKYISGYLEDPHIKEIYDDIYENLNNVSNEVEFMKALLQIRADMVGELIPESEEYKNLHVWTNILKDLDETIVSSINQIERDEELNDLLHKAYENDELEYMKILAASAKSEKELLKIIKSDKEMKYRFFAYMNLVVKYTNKDVNIDFDGLIDKKEVIKYLKEDYDIDSIDFSDFKNVPEFRNLRGMILFVMEEDVEMYDYREILIQAMLGYDKNVVYKSVKDVTKNPVFIASVMNRLDMLKVNLAFIDKNDFIDLYLYSDMIELGKKLSIPVNINNNVENISEIKDAMSWSYVTEFMVSEINSIDSNGYDFQKLIDDYIVQADAEVTINKNMLFGVMKKYSKRMEGKEIDSKMAIKILEESIKEYLKSGRFNDSNFNTGNRAFYIKAGNYINNGDNYVTTEYREKVLNAFLIYVQNEINNEDTYENIDYYDFINSKITEFTEYDININKYDKVNELISLYAANIAKQEIEAKIITQDEKENRIKEVTDSFYNGNKDYMEPQLKQKSISLYITGIFSLFIALMSHFILNFKKYKNMYKLNADSHNILNEGTNFKILNKMLLLINHGNSILMQTYNRLANIFFEKRHFKQGEMIHVAVIYKNIYANQINNYTKSKNISDKILYEKIFVIRDVMSMNTSESLKFKSLGLKIEGNPVYISINTDAIFLYADNIADYDQFVSLIKNNTSLHTYIIKHINSRLNKTLKKKNIDFISAKVDSNNVIKYIKTEKDIITIPGVWNNDEIIDILESYIDIMTRQGFIIRENIFRYIDDFNINATLEERQKEFLDILNQQKNISSQLIVDYKLYNQLLQDFGESQFAKLLNKIKENNIKIYILFSSGAVDYSEMYRNNYISGYISFKADNAIQDNQQIDNIICDITDSLTFDRIEAVFVSGINSNSCIKIIKSINENIEKQPLIFRNSSIKQAINNQRDITVYAYFRNIFTFGKLSNILSDMKSLYVANKFAETYTIEELSQSFNDNDREELLKLYKKYILAKDQTNVWDNNVIISILKKSEALNKFFKIIDTSSIDKFDIFLEQIILRIYVAGVLQKSGKELGLKNHEYENILSKAFKLKFINEIDSEEIEKEIEQLKNIKDQLLKEQKLKQYIKKNINRLSSRAFSQSKPDSIAINSIIFLMPYAESVDIKINITKMSLQRYDLKLTKDILSAA